MNLDLISRIEKNTQMKVNGDECPYLTFKKWDNLEILAAFSTRYGGVSSGDCATMNLSFAREINKDNVRENFRRITFSMGIDATSLISTNQTHTNNVIYVNRKDICDIEDTKFNDVDGLITDDTKVTLTAFFADCVPLYIYDEYNRTIALLHAGWRGTVNDIASVAVKMMSDNKKRFKVAIGPSISVNNYEVEIDVARYFFDKYDSSIINDIIIRKDDSKFLLNLQKANEYNFKNLGIEDIVQSELCTYDFNKDVFSHRYTKGKRGNSAAFFKLL